VIIYLYKKTHRITGLKYLGKTSKNPYKYLGSGLNWIQHIKEYGKEIDTEILKECNSNEEVSFWGRYYSDLWNVSTSNEWANIIPETGGSAAGRKRPQKAIEITANKNRGKTRTAEFKANRTGSLNSFFNKKHSEETKKIMSQHHADVSGSNNPMYGKPHPNKGKTGIWKWSKAVVLTKCPHCDRDIGGISNFRRFHGDNCKKKIL